MQLLRLTIITIILFCCSSSYAQYTVKITSGQWPPYVSPALEHYGFAAHVVSKAFNAVNLNAEYGFFPWQRSYNYAQQGFGSDQTWHGSLAWVSTEERRDDFYYSDEIISDVEVLFHLKSSPIEWDTISDLSGKVIGGTLYTSYPTLEEASKKGLLILQRAGDYQTLFSRLLAKRVDAIPLVMWVGKHFIESSLTPEEHEKIAISPTIIQHRRYHLILTKQRKENQKLITEFNKGLAIIKENGTYDKLYKGLNNGSYSRPVSHSKNTK